MHSELVIMEYSCRSCFEESGLPGNRNILSAVCAKLKQCDLLTVHKDSFVEWFHMKSSIIIPVSHRYFGSIGKQSSSQFGPCNWWTKQEKQTEWTKNIEQGLLLMPRLQYFHMLKFYTANLGLHLLHLLQYAAVVPY